MIKKYWPKSEKGFSIVELLVVLPIFGILAFFLAYIGIFHFQTYDSQTAELTITADARGALDDIDNYVRQANRVLTSYLAYNTSPSVLVLQIPSLDSGGQTISATYDTVVFYVSGTDLYRQVFSNFLSSRPNITQKLASNVQSNTFYYDNVDYFLVKQVTTEISILQNAGTKTRSINISSQSKLRNY